MLASKFKTLIHCRFLIAEQCFETIDIYEQQTSAGGVWNYAPIGPAAKVPIPQTNPNQALDKPLKENDDDKKLTFITPMYDHLISNIPKPIISYSDKPLPSDISLFPSREFILQYLEESADDVKHLVKFHTQVQDVQLESSSTGRDSWHVDSQDLLTKKSSSATYDAIAICSGHFSVPYIPAIPGIEEWNSAFPGVISHSKLYRSSEAFRGKKVIVIGNSASGSDIASQIANTSLHPVLISIRSKPMIPFKTSSFKVEVPEIAEFLNPRSTNRRAIRFIDGTVEENIDAILFCTGYLYSYPFLPSLRSDLITDGFRVQHAYKHIFYIPHSTLAFLGLPWNILPFPFSEAQSAVLARVWSSRLSLPSEPSMLAWEEERIAARGSGKKFHNMSSLEDFRHHNELYNWAAQTDLKVGKMPHRWNAKEFWIRERIWAIKGAFAEKEEEGRKVKTIEELGFDYESWRKEQNRDKDDPHE